jgi:hypothetical protein
MGLEWGSTKHGGENWKLEEKKEKRTGIMRNLEWGNNEPGELEWDYMKPCVNGWDHVMKGQETWR